MILPDIIGRDDVKNAIHIALEEDIGIGDATTLSIVSDSSIINAEIIAREKCVVSGNNVAEVAFKKIDPNLDCHIKIPDGEYANSGAIIMNVKGSAHGILTAERTVLNFMQRMTGIASLTSCFVEKVKPYNVIILDTRKTTPCLRVFEKYAVLCGGGTNHRFGLYDRILIKDNHRRFWRKAMDSRLDLAVLEARKKFPALPVEVEVETESELLSALKGNPDWILLDNMPVDMLKRCVRLSAGQTRLEASGGICIKNVEEIASTGIDAISLGCITHSVPATDLSLEIS